MSKPPVPLFWKKNEESNKLVLGKDYTQGNDYGLCVCVLWYGYNISRPWEIYCHDNPPHLGNVFCWCSEASDSLIMITLSIMKWLAPETMPYSDHNAPRASHWLLSVSVAFCSQHDISNTVLCVWGGRRGRRAGSKLFTMVSFDLVHWLAVQSGAAALENQPEVGRDLSRRRWCTPLRRGDEASQSSAHNQCPHAPRRGLSQVNEFLQTGKLSICKVEPGPIGGDWASVCSSERFHYLFSTSTLLFSPAWDCTYSTNGTSSSTH